MKKISYIGGILAALAPIMAFAITPAEISDISARLGSYGVTQQSISKIETILSSELAGGNDGLFTTISTHEDRATSWNGFRPGTGYGTSHISNDWNWQFTIPQNKKIKKITIENRYFNEAWSTDISDVFDKQPYPLVIFAGGKQVNLDYNQDITALSGQILIFGQIETGQLYGARAFISYTDGTQDIFVIKNEYFSLNSLDSSSRPWIAIDAPNGKGNIEPGKRVSIVFRKNKSLPIDIELWKSTQGTNGYTFTKYSTVITDYTGNSPYIWTVPTLSSSNKYRLYVKYSNMNDTVGDLSDDDIDVGYTTYTEPSPSITPSPTVSPMRTPAPTPSSSSSPIVRPTVSPSPSPVRIVYPSPEQISVPVSRPTNTPDPVRSSPAPSYLRALYNVQKKNIFERIFPSPRVSPSYIVE
jgi:hypothetical protein